MVLCSWEVFSTSELGGGNLGGEVGSESSLSESLWVGAAILVWER